MLSQEVNMSVAIKVPDVGWSEQIVTLNKKSYLVELYYSGQDDWGFWSLGLKDIKGNVLISGTKIVPSKDFVTHHNLRRVLGGILYVDSILDIPVTRDNFGENKNHRLVFIPEERLSELQI